MDFYGLWGGGLVFRLSQWKRKLNFSYLMVFILWAVWINPIQESLTAGATTQPISIQTRTLQTYNFNGFSRIVDAVSRPVLKIAITGPVSTRVGERVTLTFRLSHDPEAGDGTPVSDILFTTNLEVAAEPGGGDINKNGILESQETWLYILETTIKQDDPDPYQVISEVSGLTLDGKLIRGSSSHIIDLEFKPVIQVDTGKPSSVVIGDTVTYNITATNNIITDEPVRVEITKTISSNLRETGQTNWDLSKLILRLGNPDTVQAVGFVVAGAFLGFLVSFLIYRLVRKKRKGILVLGFLVGLMVGYAYSGLFILGWTGEPETAPSATIAPTLIPTPVPTLEVERPVELLADGSPISAVKVTGPDHSSILYLTGDSDSDQELDPGETWIYQVSSTVAQTDPDLLIHTLIVSGKDRDGDLISTSSSHILEIEFKPDIDIVKTGPETAMAGEPVTYGFTISNNVDSGDGSPVSEVKVMDGLAGLAVYLEGDRNEDGMLEAGESWIYSITHTLSPTDPIPTERTVFVSGLVPDGSLVRYTGSYNLDVAYNPAVNLQVSGPKATSAGNWATYIITLTQDVDLGDGSPIGAITLADSLEGSTTTNISNISDGDELLEIGEIWIFKNTYAVLGTDPNPIDHSFTITGKDVDGDLIVIDDHQSLVIDFNPTIQISVSGPDSANIGEQIALKLTVAHEPDSSDGSPIIRVQVADKSDAKINYVEGDLDADQELDDGESWTFEAIYTLRPDESDQLVDLFSVSGQDRDGDTVSHETNYSLEIESKPVITIFETGPGSAWVGEFVTYEIKISNNRNVGDGSPISDVTVADSILGNGVYLNGDSDQDGHLDIGETWSYEIRYQVQSTDPDPIRRSVVATGQDQEGDVVRAETKNILEVEYNPAIQIDFTGPYTVAIGDVLNIEVNLNLDSENGDGSPVSDLAVGVPDDHTLTYTGGDSDEDGLLESGENWTYTLESNYKTSASIQIQEWVRVEGQDLDGDPVRTENFHNILVFSPFRNGNFETEFLGWALVDGELPAAYIEKASTADPDIPDGQYSLLLGSTEYPCSPSGVPLGFAEVRQSFTVPEASEGQSIGLGFHYVIYSQDVSTRPTYDRFEVTINDNPTPAYSDGNMVNAGLGCNVWQRVPGPQNSRDGKTSGWARGYIDLGDYQGQTIILSFKNHNRYDGWYNTYTYLDNIEIVIGE